jgi:hypothetical protein
MHLKMNLDFNPMPDRPMPSIIERTRPESENDGDSSVIFDPSEPMRLKDGYVEGCYRLNQETVETITWNSDGEQFMEGKWVSPAVTVNVPWPYRYAFDPMPAYHPEFIDKLSKTQDVLDAYGSYQQSDASFYCCFCNHSIAGRHARFYLLNLTAFRPNRVFRWTSIFLHYLIKHRVLPTRMFARIILEREL